MAVKPAMVALHPVADMGNRPSTPNPHPFAVLVIKVHPVLPVQKAPTEKMVKMDLLEKPDTMERMPYSCPPRNPSLVSSAQLDLPDPTDQWEPKDHPDPREPPASHHAMEFPATLAWLDNPDPWAGQAEKAPEEPPEPLDDFCQFLDPKDHLDLPDHPESKGPRANLVPTDRASKVHPEKPESQVHPAKKDDPDPLELLVQPETPVKKADATTAQNHVPHQAIKRDTPTERSGFRNFGHGTLIFCFIFTTGRKPKKIIF